MTAPPKTFAQALQDRYTIERELGRGGMATVYLALDLRHKRRVALKLMRPELGSVIGPERFIREIRLTARLQHPHILPVFDSGETEGLLWYTMPYIEGESLRVRLARESQLPIEEAVRLTCQLAEALQYAHGEGIVHRDIKPENILLSRGHALVADFGVAQVLDVDSDGKLTETGLAMGTVAYMSPEQASGGHIDGRADLYALGCVLYEMLAGEPPYTGPNAHAVIAKRFTEPVPRVQRLRPTVPPPVANSLERALALVPADRFPSAEAFATALAVPERDSAPAGSSRPRRKNLTAWIAGGLMAATALGIGFWRYSTASPSSDTGNPRPVRIAVIPFENQGPRGQEYLATGIADAVRGKLAALPEVQVIASSSSEEYRSRRKPLAQVGKELGVNHLIVGRVHAASDGSRAGRLEVVSQLVDTHTGAVRWEKPYEITPEEIVQVQAEIAVRVAEALGLRLQRTEKVRLGDSLTSNAGAYDAYLRGIEARRQYQHYNGGVAPVIALFRRAIELDTGLALAKVQLADALRGAAMESGDTTRFREADSLLAAVLRAHPDLADAYVVQAEIRQYQDKPGEAYRLLLRAATLQKNSATVLGRLAWLQATEGDSAATSTGAMAVSLAPRDPDMLRQVVAGTAIFRHFEELEGYCDRLIELSPDDQMGYLNKALAQVWSRGDTAGAMETLRGAERVIGRFQAWMVWPYAMAGPSGWTRLRTVGPSVLAPTDGLSDSVTFYLWKARIARLEQRPRELRVNARTIVELVNRAPQSLPGRGTLLLARAYARGVLGDQTGATRDLASSEAALAKLPVSWRNQWGPDVAEAYALVRDTARAFAEIDRTLRRPTGYTRRGLTLSPEFSWLWGTPLLSRLLEDGSLP